MTPAKTPTATPDERPPAEHVVAALARVMGELGGIGKDMNSPQGYSYRGIEQITARAQTLFAKHGVVVVPTIVGWHEPTLLTVNGKPWTDERITVRFRFYGPGGSEDYVDAVTVGIGRDNADKGTNKAMSQAFKYALLQVLCIGDSSADTDGHDAANADGSHTPQAQPSGPVVSAGIANGLRKRLEAIGKELGAYPAEWIDAHLPTLAGMGTLPKSRRAEAEAIIVQYEQGMPALTTPPEAEPADDAPREQATPNADEPAADDSPQYGPGEEPF
jgi:hypothetical protein